MGRRAEDALADLPAGQAHAVRLRFVDDLAYDELATRSATPRSRPCPRSPWPLRAAAPPRSFEGDHDDRSFPPRSTVSATRWRRQRRPTSPQLPRPLPRRRRVDQGRGRRRPFSPSRSRASPLAATQLIGEKEVAESLPAGTLALAGTSPSCTVVVQDVEYLCTLERAPAPEVSDWKGRSSRPSTRRST